MRFCVTQKAFMPCPLEVNSNGRFKRENVESFPSITKDLMSPLLQCIGPLNLTGWNLPWRASTINSHDPIIMWSCKFTRQTKKYLHYQSVYDHQSWQDGYLLWWAPAHKVTGPFDCVVSQDHVIYKNHISTYTVPMTTKLGKMITYLQGLLPIKSHEALIVWSCKITWQTKTTISPLPQNLMPTNFAGWWHNNEERPLIKLHDT